MVLLVLRRRLTQARRAADEQARQARAEQDARDAHHDTRMARTTAEHTREKEALATELGTENKRLADQMVAIAPDNMKWRMEVQNADANLALVLSAQRRFREAAAQWAQAYKMIDALSTADPSNRDYQQSLAESLAWYADASKDAGDLKRATQLRERNVALLKDLQARKNAIIDRQQRYGHLVGDTGFTMADQYFARALGADLGTDYAYLHGV